MDEWHFRIPTATNAPSGRPPYMYPWNFAENQISINPYLPEKNCSNTNRSFGFWDLRELDHATPLGPGAFEQDLCKFHLARCLKQLH